jgi:hypothetical protein
MQLAAQETNETPSRVYSLSEPADYVRSNLTRCSEATLRYLTPSAKLLACDSLIRQIYSDGDCLRAKSDVSCDSGEKTR